MDGANNRINPNNARSTRPAYIQPQSRTSNQPYRPAQTANRPNRMAQPNSMNLPVQARQRQMAELQRQRELERRRRAAERRQEEARRLAEETKRRAEAAAKVAAKEARKAQVKLYRELRKLNTITTDKRYTFPMAIIATAIAFTMLILAIVTTSVRISEITTENSALQRSYDALLSDENKLRMELEVRDDLRTVEELAKNEYGMVKQDQVERYYLRTYNADKIEIIEEEKPVETTSFTDRVIDIVKMIGERVLSFFR